MTVGSSGSGKHWTKSEVESRQAAAENFRRGGKRVVLRAPAWLNDPARIVWKNTVKRLRGLELLDTLDTDLLAMYCDAVAKYQKVSEAPEMDSDAIKALQAWSRLVLAYAEKLGLSPGGRARLAKKKAEKKADDFADAFDG